MCLKKIPQVVCQLITYANSYTHIVSGGLQLLPYPKRKVHGKGQYTYDAHNWGCGKTIMAHQCRHWG
jgi:hypothetical protein